MLSSAVLQRDAGAWNNLRPLREEGEGLPDLQVPQVFWQCPFIQLAEHCPFFFCATHAHARATQRKCGWPRYTYGKQVSISTKALCSRMQLAHEEAVIGT